MEQQNGVFPMKKPASTSALIEVESDRAIQQVQAAVVMAKKFPRTPSESKKRILEACKNWNLADQAEYEYPRGKDKNGKPNMVTGPSIRLAEVIAQQWGNLDVSTVVLHRSDDETNLMTYAWDLETNTKQSTVFTARHWRDTQEGGYALKDERDIYEMTANLASRRRRACILAIVPPDLVDAAVAQCRATLRESANSTPPDARVTLVLSAFAKVRVSRAMIEKKLGHSLETLTEEEYLQYERIYTTIKDSVAKVEDFFETEEKPLSTSEKLNKRFSGEQKSAPPSDGTFDAAPGGSVPLSDPAHKKEAKPVPTPAATLSQVQDQVFSLSEELKLSLEALNDISMKELKKAFGDLGLVDLKKFAVILQAEKKKAVKK